MSRGTCTITELSALLRLPETVVQQLAEQRCIPAERIDGDWSFQRADIERWLDQGRRRLMDDMQRRGALRRASADS